MKHFRRRLQRLGGDRAGRRFQNLHPPPGEAKGQGAWKRGAKLLLGLLLILVGIFLLAIPGPGLLAMLLGVAILASGFRPVARLLDRAEVVARQGLRDVSHRWRNAHCGWKVAAAVGLLAAVLAAVGFGVWLILV